MSETIRKNYFIIFSLLLVATISLWNFETNPAFWFDEGIIAQVAKNLALYGKYGIQLEPSIFDTNSYWITVNYPVTFPTALFIKLFGVGIWQARLTPFLYLFGFVAVSHFTLKKLFGFYVARLGTALLITFSPFYGNGVAVLGEVPGLFWLFLGILFLAHYEEKRGKLFVGGAALCFGLAASTKPFYLLVIPGVLVALFILWRRKKTIDGKDTLLFGGLMVIPLMVWAVISFDFSFFHNAGFSLSYFLNSYADESLWHNVLQNLKRFVSESTPIHFLFLTAVSLAALYRRRKEILDVKPALIILGIFVAVSFLWYLKTPGWYRYFFSIHVIVLLLFPVALHSISRKFATVMVVMFVLFQGIHLASTRNTFASNEVIRVADYVKNLRQEEEKIFVVSKPELAYLLPNEHLLQYLYINKTLSFGQPRLPSERPKLVVTGRDEDYFIKSNPDILIGEYVMLKNFGHYKIYEHAQKD